MNVRLPAQAITPFQEAKAIVEAMPAWPDALMISRMIAEELGDPSAHAKLLDLPPQLALQAGSLPGGLPGQLQLLPPPQHLLGGGSQGKPAVAAGDGMS